MADKEHVTKTVYKQITVASCNAQSEANSFLSIRPGRSTKA